MTELPPLREGTQQLTAEWSLVLPSPMARRIDDGSLVFWHSPRKFTSWLDIWTPDSGEGACARLETIKQECSPAAFDKIEEQVGKLLRYAYRLDENSGDGSLPSLLTDALSLWRSLQWIDRRH